MLIAFPDAMQLAGGAYYNMAVASISMASKIESIELWPVHVPFKATVRQIMQAGEGGLGMAIKAEDPWLGEDFVICRLQSDDGHAGIGEVFMWLPETGVLPSQVIDVIQKALYKYVIGADPIDVREICHKMDNNVARNEVAKGLLDMACYDLASRIKGCSASEFLGNKTVSEVHLTTLVPLADLETMIALSKMYVSMGHRTIRVKLGKGPSKDQAIMKAVRDAVGYETRVRVDYNQAYTPNDAVAAIRAIEPYKIDVAEQPVALDDYLGMSFVQHAVKVPLMAHEGCFSLRDFLSLAELGAVKVLGINSERPGGVTRALEAIDHAKKRGMGIVIHNQPLGIASAMHLHLAAANYSDLGHDPEVFGTFMLEDDLITKPIKYVKGKAKVPVGPGWGVDLDLDALEKYATGPPVLIKAR